MKTRSRTPIFFLTMLFLLGLGVAWVAQGANAEEPRVLGLDQLIRMALEASPEIHAAEQDVTVAASDLEQARAAQWAQLDMKAVIGPVNDAEEPTVVSREDPPGSGRFIGKIDTPKEDDEISGIGPFGRLEFAIVQPLYTFGKITNRKEAALRTVKIRQAEIEQRKGEVIRKVKALYFSLILAKQGKETAEETDAFYEDARTRIKRLLDLGSMNVDQSDLYRLESYAADARRFLVKADTGARLTYRALKQTVGLSPEEEFQLDLKELPTETQPLGDQEVYITKALEWRPELEQIEKGLQARHYLVDAAEADLYPSIFAAAMGTFSRAPGRDDLDDPYINDGFNSNHAGVVLGAKWHFDLGIGQAKVRKARAEYQRMLHTKVLAERNIPLEVAKYYYQALEHQAAFQALEQAAAAARKWVVVAFANFDMGVGSAKDIFDAVERYSRNQGEFLYSLYKYHVALANLSYSVGEYRSKSM